MNEDFLQSPDGPSQSPDESELSPGESGLLAASLRRAVIPVPLAWPMGVLILGILAGRYCPVPIDAWLAVALVGALAGAISLRSARYRTLTVAVLILAGLGVGAARFQLAYHTAETTDVARFFGQGRSLATFRGRVVGVPQRVEPGDEFGYRPKAHLTFLVEADSLQSGGAWLSVSGLVRVRLDESFATFRSGDRVELVGWMGRFSGPGNPGGYDAAAAAKQRGEALWCRVPLAQGATVLPAGRWDGVMRWFWRWRGSVRSQLTDVDDAQGGPLLGALVLGQRSDALASLNHTMRRAGIAHFLSISGLHLGVFLGFAYLLCRVMCLSPRRAAAVVLVLLGAYLLLAQPRAPLLRSAIMAAALAGSVLLGRPHSTLNALCAAAMILLLVDPLQLYQPGFQLSFGIVAGLLLWHDRVRQLLFGRGDQLRGLRVDDPRRETWRRRAARASRYYFTQYISLSVTAYLIAAPLAAWHFGMFSPYAIGLTVLVFPLVVAVLVPGYVAMALAGVTPNLSGLFATVAARAASILAWGVECIASLPGLSLSVRPVSAGWVVLYYAALIAVLFARRRRWRRVCAGVLVAGFVVVTVLSQQEAAPPPGAQLHLLDVGGGQCVVLQTPDGATWLLDAGTRSGFDVHERTLAPFLRERRLPYPTAAFVSHANTDHYSALPAMLAQGHCEGLYLGDYFRRTDDALDPANRLLDLARDRAVPLRRLRAGDVIPLDDQTTVEVLWPAPGRTDLTPNGTSLVLKLTCAGKAVLLPGDLDAAGQGELLTNPAALDADVLVLPHHGSWVATLPAFVEAVSPRVILVSSASDPKGPATAKPEVRTFYQTLRTRYRYHATAKDGWVQLTLTPGPIDIQTMHGNK